MQDLDDQTGYKGKGDKFETDKTAQYYANLSGKGALKDRGEREAEKVRWKGG